MQDRKGACTGVRHGMAARGHPTLASIWRQSFHVQGLPRHGQLQSVHQGRVAYKSSLDPEDREVERTYTIWLYNSSSRHEVMQSMVQRVFSISVPLASGTRVSALPA